MAAPWHSLDNQMKSFKEYLEHVDPENYGEKPVVIEETPSDKRWKVAEASRDCGWGAFEGNQTAVAEYVKWITRR